MAKQRTRIGDLSHRVALCSQKDIVTKDGDMALLREDVTHAWVKIEPKLSSMYSRDGMAIMENRDRQTHLITMRMRRDFDIASSAWMFEKRLQSGSRWFKILGVKEESENGEFMVLSAKLYSRGDADVEPVSSDESAAMMQRVQHGVSI